MSKVFSIIGYFLIGVGLSGAIAYSALIFPNIRIMVYVAIGFYVIATIFSILFDDAIAQMLKLKNTPQWWVIVGVILFLVVLGSIWQVISLWL